MKIKKKEAKEYDDAVLLARDVEEQLDILVLGVQEKIYKAQKENRIFIGAGIGDLDGESTKGLIYGYISLLTDLNTMFDLHYVNNLGKLADFFENKGPCKIFYVDKK